MSQQDPKEAAAAEAAKKAAEATKKAAHKTYITELQASNGITKELQAAIGKLGDVKGAIIAHKEYSDRHVVISHDNVGPNKFEFAKA